MLELTVRLVLSLSLIVGILLLLTRLGARRFSGRHGSLIRVVHRQALTRGASVAVVTVGSRILVLGTTEHQVNVLSELDPDELELAELADLIIQDEDDAVPASDGPAVVTEQPARRSRGAHRSASTAAAPPTPGALAGSVLSLQTWRQAIGAATGRPS